MTRNKDVREGSPSRSKLALENDTSTAKQESRKRAWRQLATRVEVTLTNDNDLPVQEPMQTPILEPIPQRKFKAATRSIDPILDS